MMNSSQRWILFFVLLFSLLIATFVFAEVKDFVSINVINSTPNGFQYYSNSSGITNGTTLRFANFSTQYILINISFLRNGSHGGYTNVTFSWKLSKNNASFMRNDTFINNTFNASYFNSTWISMKDLTEGVYNISVWVENSTGGQHANEEPIVNYSAAFEVAVDRPPPNVTNVVTNYTGDGFNFTTNRKMELNATVNDSITYVVSVVFSLDNGNGTTFNLTGVRGAGTNTSTYVAELSTDTIREGYYTVRALTYDTLGNRNTTETVRFGIDWTPPNVTTFAVNFSNNSNFSSRNVALKVEFNTTVNDSSTGVKNVYFGLENGNGTETNMTAARNVTQWMTELVLSTIGDGVYTVRPYANDSVNNLNNSGGSVLGPLTFRLDRTPPNVTTFAANFSNASNFSASTLPFKLEFNVTANDSTTYTANVVFGLANGNGTESNTTAKVNTTQWSVEIVSSNLGDGIYTATPYVNDSVGNLNKTIGIITFSVDRTTPNVTAFAANFSNASNFSSRNVAPKLEFNATVNDSTTGVKNVYFGLENGNGTETNMTAARNVTQWMTELVLSTIGDGVYTVRPYANDSVNNLNNSGGSVLGPLTFRLDRTPPNVTTFAANFSNASNFSSRNVALKLEFNATVNDSTTGVKNVYFGLENGNGTETNITAARNVTQWMTELVLSTIGDGVYTVRPYANDSVDNLNNSGGSVLGP